MNRFFSAAIIPARAAGLFLALAGFLFLSLCHRPSFASCEVEPCLSGAAVPFDPGSGPLSSATAQDAIQELAVEGVQPWDAQVAYNGNGETVQYDGKLWVSIAASTNVAPDSDATKWRLAGPISMEDTSEATTEALQGVTFGNGLDSNVSDTTGVADLTVDAADLDGDGLGNSAGELLVNVDNSTIEKNADALRAKDGGITRAKLAAYFLAEDNDGNCAGTGGSALNLDFTTNANKYFTITANCEITVTDPTSTAGQIAYVSACWTQGGAGGFTLAWPANFKWDGATEKTWGTTAGDDNCAVWKYRQTDDTYVFQGGTADY